MSREVTFRLPSVSGLGRRLGAPLRWVRLPRSRTSLFVLGALVMLALVVDVALVVDGRADASEDRARSEALKAAEARVPSMLSYRYADLEADLKVAGGNTTGSFKGRYQKVLDEVVLPNARKRKVSTQATVAAASVVSASDDEADVLLFVNQATTSATAAKPVTSGSRVVVTMTKTDDGWFVSALDPV